MATWSKAKIAAVVALVLGVLGLFGAVAVVLAVLYLLPPFIEQQLLSQARKAGVELQIGGFDYGLGWVQMRSCRVSLVGVKGIRATIRRADVDFVGFTPVAIDADGVSVHAEGSAASLALQLTAWTKNYPQTYAMKLVARNVDLDWKREPGGATWLKLSGGTVVPAGGGGAFSVKRALVAGVDVGKVGMAWTKTDTQIGLGFGAESAAKAPVRIHVQYALPAPTADIVLIPTELSKLAEPLGIPLPIKNVIASGRAKLVFPPAGQTGGINGAVRLRLKGYVPPHPPELDGFIFGNETMVESKFAIAEDHQLVTLSDTKVKAGAFVLRGGGKITRLASHARIQLNLRGNLDCVSLAGAVAESRLGRIIGEIVRFGAPYTIKGSVAVVVKIDADTRRLADAKMVRLIGNGCGFKSIKLPNLDDFKDLPIIKDLPPMPSGLPPLPEDLSEVPFPDFSGLATDAK